VRVDLDGCPLYDLPAVGATKVVPLTFRAVRGLQQLTLQAQTELDKIAIAMRLTPNSRWEIGGHTSSSGAAARNLRVSQQRADAVRTYLVGKGVSPESLMAVGYGAERPVGSNRTAAGRRLNTRVEIKRLQ
jgi:OOP family OmpA-OmpF porin